MKSQPQLKLLNDRADAFFVIKDAQGRFIYLNRSARAAFSAGGTDMIGKTLFDVLPRSEAELSQQMDEEVTRTGQCQTRHRTVTDETGTERYLIHKFPIPLERHPGAIGEVVVDISNEHHLAN